MKVMRGVLIVMLLCAGFTSVAQASEPVTGYVQLVSRVDTNLSMAEQTLAGLQPLVRGLLAARAAGRLISYEPLLEVGVLKIVYDASAGVPDIEGRVIYDQLGEAVPADLARPQAPGAVSAGDLGTMGGGCPLVGGIYTVSLGADAMFTARCLGIGQPIHGTVRDGAGNILAVFDATADGSGLITKGFFWWLGSQSVIKPGFRIAFSQFNGITWDTVSLVVPTVKFSSISKALTRVSGKGAPGQFVRMEWYHQNVDSGGLNMYDGDNYFYASATGSWTVDLGAVPFRGGDRLIVTSYASPNFEFSRPMQVPFTYCQLGGFSCYVTGFAGKAATFQIIQGAAIYNFSGHFNQSGYFYPNLVKPNGSPLVVKAGNKVTGGTMAQYKIPKITVGLDYATDVAGGLAPASRYFRVKIYDYGSGTSPFRWIGSNAAGVYAADFTDADGGTPDLDLVTTQPYPVTVDYIQGSTGNETILLKGFAP